MTEALPKIWFSDATHQVNTLSIDFVTDRPEMDYIREHRRFQPVERSAAPERFYLKSTPSRDKLRKTQPDIFVVAGGLLVVSEKFHDVLQKFDLGKTRMFEVPLYDVNKTDLLPNRLFLLHIAETKHVIEPEKSDNVVGRGTYSPELYALGELTSFGITVFASVATEGPDLWVDERTDGHNLMFFSDHLYKAIKAAKIKAYGFSLLECTVVP
jgi:hypothetical protein